MNARIPSAHIEWYHVVHAHVHVVHVHDPSGHLYPSPSIPVITNLKHACSPDPIPARHVTRATFARGSFRAGRAPGMLDSSLPCASLIGHLAPRPTPCHGRSRPLVIVAGDGKTGTSTFAWAAQELGLATAHWREMLCPHGMSSSECNRCKQKWLTTRNSWWKLKPDEVRTVLRFSNPCALRIISVLYMPRAASVAIL